MKIAMVGLGKMGLNMARRLVEGGHEVVGYDRTPDKAKEAGAYGIKAAFSLKELAGALPVSRVVWLMVPAGEAVDGAIEGIKGSLDGGDIMVDGGNSFYKDAVRRAGELERLGIRYIDAGVSGGVWGLENGYCIMAGGDKEAFDSIEPVLKTLAPPQGYLYCGGSGSGHFVKMAHNAIEYGMMEAYAEGFELLNESEYGGGLDLHGVARLWNRGSVVRSWLLELLEGAFKDNGRLEGISGYVEDSGEGRWAVKDAVDRGVPLPVITEALYARFNSRRQDSFAAKALAALRRSFGGHAVRPEKK